MHIFFSGIGGAGIGPLALVAKQAGYDVSGSDKQNSQYIEYLKKHGISNIHIGQSKEAIEKVHQEKPIDWYVYSSAVEKEDPKAEEFKFIDNQGVRRTKRDELLNEILKQKGQKLIAIAGTHGKTTTTAMTVWLFKQLGVPISYILPAKTSFADMGHFDNNSEYFIYEADEFDRNFLSFEPEISLITGVTWDHHEIFPTREDYQQAFKEFIDQSAVTYIWQEDNDYLDLPATDKVQVLNSSEPRKNGVKLDGQYNRLDGWLAIQAAQQVSGSTQEELTKLINDFPGLQRRMEEIVPNLYSDYAHTPEKIRGGLSVALEMASKSGQAVVVVYEGLTDRRQHYMIDDYKDCFSGAKKVYWLPSYLAREDPDQKVLKPEELIEHLSDPDIAEPAERDAKLKEIIQKHIDDGDMVVAMAGGGGDSLDEWLRKEFKT